MKKQYILFVLLICLCAAACKKVTGDNQNLDPANQVWYDFMSSKTGSYWRYASRDGVLWTRYARETDTMMLGKKYRYYERKDDGSGGYDPEYFGKNNSFYLTLMDLDGNRNNYIDYVYWKDSATTGTAYTNTGEVKAPGGLKVNILIESYVAADNLTMVSGGRTYTNVVHAHSTLFGTATLIPKTNIGNVDVWFIKGLGIIREEANIDILGQYKQNYIDSLIDYHIVP